MNEQVKELIAWRDEYIQLTEETKNHPGRTIYSNNDNPDTWSANETRIMQEYESKLGERSKLRARIQNQFLFMIEEIERLEKHIVGADKIIHDQADTIASYMTEVSWYIDETGMYYPGYDENEDE